MTKEHVPYITRSQCLNKLGRAQEAVHALQHLCRWVPLPGRCTQLGISTVARKAGSRAGQLDC